MLQVMLNPVNFATKDIVSKFRQYFKTDDKILEEFVSSWKNLKVENLAYQKIGYFKEQTLAEMIEEENQKLSFKPNQ